MKAMTKQTPQRRLTRQADHAKLTNLAKLTDLAKQTDQAPMRVIAK